jgi:uncharacterized membrane protein
MTLVILYGFWCKLIVGGRSLLSLGLVVIVVVLVVVIVIVVVIVVIVVIVGMYSYGDDGGFDVGV